MSVAEINILDRSVYENMKSQGSLETDGIYFVREGTSQTAKILSLYVGESKQCDLLDITDIVDVDLDDPDHNYNIPISYQVRSKMLFCKQTVSDGTSENSFYRVLMWDGTKFLDCMGSSGGGGGSTDVYTDDVTVFKNNNILSAVGAKLNNVLGAEVFNYVPNATTNNSASGISSSASGISNAVAGNYSHAFNVGDSTGLEDSGLESEPTGYSGYTGISSQAVASISFGQSNNIKGPLCQISGSYNTINTNNSKYTYIFGTNNFSNGTNNQFIFGSNNKEDTTSGYNSYSILSGNNNSLSQGGGNTYLYLHGNGNNMTGTGGCSYINLDGNSNYLSSLGGCSYVSLTGEGNYLTTGVQANHVYLRGKQNNLQGGSGKGYIFMNGESNHLTNGSTNTYYIYMNGENNEISNSPSSTHIYLFGHYNRLLNSTGANNQVILGESNDVTLLSNNQGPNLFGGNENTVIGDVAYSITWGDSNNIGTSSENCYISSSALFGISNNINKSDNCIIGGRDIDIAGGSSSTNLSNIIVGEDLTLDSQELNNSKFIYASALFGQGSTVSYSHTNIIGGQGHNIVSAQASVIGGRDITVGAANKPTSQTFTTFPISVTGYSSPHVTDFSIYGNTVNSESVGELTVNMAPPLYSWTSGKLDSTGQVVSAGSDTKDLVSPTITVQPNSNYTFYINNSSTSRSYVLAQYSSDDSQITQVSNTFTTSVTVQMRSNTSYIRISFANYDNTNDPFLHEGSTDIDFEPYGYKIAFDDGSNATKNIYIKDVLRKSSDGTITDVLNYETKTLTRNVDNNFNVLPQPTIEDIEVPKNIVLDTNITTITFNTTVQPSRFDISYFSLEYKGCIGSAVFGQSITNDCSDSFICGHDLWTYDDGTRNEGIILLGSYNPVSWDPDYKFAIANGYYDTISHDPVRSFALTLNNSGNLQLYGDNTSSTGNIFTSTGVSLSTIRDVINTLTGTTTHTFEILPKNSHEVLFDSSLSVSSITITDISTMEYETGCEYEVFNSSSGLVAHNVETSQINRSDDYSCILMFKKDSSVTTAQNLLTNFTSSGTDKIYLLNPDIDISNMTVIHIMLFYDGFNMCAIVSGYNYGS